MNEDNVLAVLEEYILKELIGAEVYQVNEANGENLLRVYQVDSKDLEDDTVIQALEGNKIRFVVFEENWEENQFNHQEAIEFFDNKDSAVEFCDNYY